MKHFLFLGTTCLVIAHMGHSQYFVDDSTFGADQIYVDTTGLGWLNLNNSENRSIDDVSSQFGVGGDFEGFRYATDDEFFNLVDNLIGLSIPSWDQSWSANPSFEEMNTLLSAVGLILEDNLDSFYDKPAFFDYSLGIFSEDTILWMFAIDFIDPSASDTGFITRSFWGDSIASDTAASGIGHFLVADGFTPVPEPAIIGLLATGGLGTILFIRRMIKQRPKNI